MKKTKVLIFDKLATSLLPCSKEIKTKKYFGIGIISINLFYKATVESIYLCLVAWGKNKSQNDKIKINSLTMKVTKMINPFKEPVSNITKEVSL